MISPEHLVPHKRQGYKTFSSEAQFEPDLWRPALTAIHEAETYGQQQDAISAAIIGYAAYTKFPMSESKNKLTINLNSFFGFKARFRITNGAFDLRSAQFGTLQASYPSQPEVDDSPTFAVIDQATDLHPVHEVVKTRNQMLGYAGKLLSREATFHMAFSFDSRYPALEIGRQLGLNLDY